VALFQPTNITPSSFAGDGGLAVDATSSFNVSWQVNGSSGMVAYQIDIYENDPNSTFVYSTGRQPLSSPFFGVDFAGNIRFFTAPIPVVSELENGNQYKLKITQWWSASDSVVQSQLSVFLTRATPSVAVNTFRNPVNTRNQTFSATFAQEDGDTLN
jgi:hypothetical protein